MYSICKMVKCRRLNGRRLREPGDHTGRSIAHRRYNTSVALKCDTASKSPRFPVSCCNVADLEVQSHIIASVAERSNAGDCKSPGLRPTLVRIQPGARVQKSAQAFAWAIFVRAPGEQYLSTVRLDSKRRRLCFSTSWRETSEAPSKKLSLFYECREIK